MKKVLWFSRHPMTDNQKAALGECEMRQVSATIKSAKEIQADIDWADVIAIVAPIGLAADFLRCADEKPVIMAVSERTLVRDLEGKESYEFKFVKWEQLDEIRVVKHDYIPD